MLTTSSSDDFLSFSEVNLSKFAEGRKLISEEEKDDLETRISQKYDRAQYPWVSDFTLKIKDAQLFLHNEILDFVNFISPSDKDI